MYFKIIIPVFFTITLLIPLSPSFSQDSIFKETNPQNVVVDSLIQRTDTVTDVKPAVIETQDNNSAIKSKVIYNAVDSIRFDVDNQKVFLFGEANVLYEDMELDAAYIEFDMTRNIAFAHGARDSLGNVALDSAGMPIGDPLFSDAGKTFDAKEITYNFKTKKGKIRDVTTQEGEAFIHAKDAKKDTGDIYFIKNGRYTTCDLEHPHFYLKASKIKIIPDDKIICGPAYLVVSDVPTPLGIPFGVFPNKKGRKSGVLIPSYGESELGFFLKDGGYYFGLSDYFDLALRGDFYSKGSYGVKSNTNYNKRYGYNGFLGLSFAQIQVSEEGLPDYKLSKDFFVRWQHAQDAKKNPTSRFSANVNAGSRTYQTYNSNTANDYLSNTFQSNVAWNKSWQGRPFNLSMSANHTQNTLNKTVDIVLPEAAFSVARQYPFKRKEQIGKPKLYEKIGLGLTLNAKNQISTYDTALFKESALEKFRNGLRATIPVSTSMNVGPIIITPSVNINGYGYFQSYNKYYNADSNTVFTDTLMGFRYAADYSKSLSFSTKFYGMYLFKKGRVKAIRHVLTPSASLSYRPDFGEPRFGIYDSVQTNAIGTMQAYSIYENSVYGYPPSGKSGFINFSLNNNLEMKLRPSKKDTSGLDRKIMLIENFGISSAYNLAAENYNWSVINISGRTKLFKTADITFSGVIDPYSYDSVLARRIERFEYNVSGKIGRLTTAAFSLSSSLRSITKKKPAVSTKQSSVKKLKQNEDELRFIQTHPDYYVDFNIPWDLAVYYNLTYSKPALEDTVIQSLTFSGNVSVTENWKVGFRSGFDFIKKDFTFTSFDIYRDLHCWEMHLNWIPFGFRKSYMLTIAVKASVLQDLKLSRKRDWYDYN